MSDLSETLSALLEKAAQFALELDTELDDIDTTLTNLEAALNAETTARIAADDQLSAQVAQLQTALSANTVADANANQATAEQIANLANLVEALDQRLTDHMAGTPDPDPDPEPDPDPDPDPDPPIPDELPAIPAVESGYELHRIVTFTDDSWRAENGGLLSGRNGVQSGTDSYNVATNPYTSNGVLRLPSYARNTGGYPYESTYIGNNSSFAGSGTENRYFPMFCKVHVAVKYPLAHLFWPATWMNAYGSAGNLEIDIGEAFWAQTPGRVVFNMHSTTNGYAYNMVNGSIGQTDWHIPSGSRSFSGTPGATRYGKAVDFDDPFSDDGHSGWHVLTTEVRKVEGNAGGWTVAIDFSVDGILACTWTDTVPDYMNGEIPVWVNPDNLDAVWDFRAQSWVGGSHIGDAVDDNGNRILTYNGKLKNGESGVAPGGVEDADLWLDDINAEYATQLGWIHVSVPTDAPNPDPDPEPDPTAVTWEFTQTGNPGDAVPNSGANGWSVGWTPAGTTCTYGSGGVNPIIFTTNDTATGCDRVWKPSSPSVPNIYSRFEFTVPALPSANTYLAHYGPATTGSYAQLRLTPDGVLVMRDSYADVAMTPAGIITAGVPILVEWGVDGGPGEQHLKVTTPTSTYTALNESYSPGDPGRFVLGTSGAPNFVIQYDRIAVDLTTWVGDR